MALRRRRITEGAQLGQAASGRAPDRAALSVRQRKKGLEATSLVSEQLALVLPGGRFARLGRAAHAHIGRRRLGSMERTSGPLPMEAGMPVPYAGGWALAVTGRPYRGDTVPYGDTVP